MGRHADAGTLTTGCRPPSRIKPTWPKVAHRLGWCRRHCRHQPHDTSPSTATRSPGERAGSAAVRAGVGSPDAITRPASSWPRVSGAEAPLRGWGVVGIMKGPSRHSSTSVPQMPQQPTASWTSPGAGGPGGSTSSRRTSPRPCQRKAFTVATASGDTVAPRGIGRVSWFTTGRSNEVVGVIGCGGQLRVGGIDVQGHGPPGRPRSTAGYRLQDGGMFIDRLLAPIGGL